MIWKLLFVSFGFASAQAKIYVSPQVLDELWASRQDEKFAKLLKIEIDQVRSDKSEEGYARSKLNNDYLYGDMLLPNEQGINYLNFKVRRWPGGKIPYFISQKSFSAEQRQIIIDAIKDLNAKTTNLKIVPHKGEKDYVFVHKGNMCRSFVGRAFGQQSLTLTEKCLIKGSIQHEFMHAAGFSHEHGRSDRDEYVKVLKQNIPEIYHTEYKKYESDASSSLGPYDYCSIMHYSFVEPNTGKPAFKILKPNVNTTCIGQRNGPTDMDLQKIEKLYS